MDIGGRFCLWLSAQYAGDSDPPSVTASMFLEFLNSERVQSLGVARAYVAAVRCALLARHITVPPGISADVEHFFRCKLESAPASVDRRGGDATPELIRDLALWALASGSRNGLWLHACIVLQWALVLSFGDACAVRLHQLKLADTRSANSRFLLANASSPELCPVLALGLLFFSQARNYQDKDAFVLGNASASQLQNAALLSARYVRALRALASEMRHDGDASPLAPDELKSLCADGIKGVAMMTIDGSAIDTGVSLPDFPHPCPCVDHLIRADFGALLESSADLLPLLRVCLASVAKNSVWLLRTSPLISSRHKTSILGDYVTLAKLRALVVVGQQGPVAGISEGADVEAHSVAAQELDTTIGSLAVLSDCMLLLRSASEQAKIAGFKRKAEGDGHVAAKRRVREVVHRVGEQVHQMRELVVSGLGASVGGSLASPPATVTAVEADALFPAEDQPLCRPYYWGGRFRMLPTGFKLARCKLKQAWRLWWLGGLDDSVLPFPPLRLIVGRVDMPPEHRNRFGNWRLLFTRLEVILRSRGCAIPARAATPVECERLYAGIQDLVDGICGPQGEKLAIDTVELRMRLPVAELIRNVEENEKKRT